jgi:hypothetical protein
MDCDTLECVKNGKLTSFYFKLLENVNNKLDIKIQDTTYRLLNEFESKKKELLKIKSQLDEFNKIKLGIDNLNTFYNFIKVNNKTNQPQNIKNVPYIKTNNANNITNLNLLTKLENIEIHIENGDFIKVSSNNTSKADVQLLANGSDHLINPQSRLLIQRKNNVHQIDKSKSSFDTSQLNIIIKFKDNRINPEDILIRYLVFPNENRLHIGYINAVLGSNDGKNWELISNINYSMLRNFEKSPLFKYPALQNHSCTNKNFYQYICFQSFPTKNIIPNTQVKQLMAIKNIPVCNFEIFGNYYSIKNEKILFNIEEEFQEFFELYINTNYEEVSKKVDVDYIINMFLESYKELNSLITDYKIQNAMKNVTNLDKVKIGVPKTVPHLKQNDQKAKNVELDLESNIDIVVDSNSFASEIKLEKEPEKEKKQEQLDDEKSIIDENYLENLINNMPPTDNIQKNKRVKNIKIVDGGTKITKNRRKKQTEEKPDDATDETSLFKKV